jgi:putative NIF3 family GTP cyclohydrolase 1 type 2
MIDCPQEIPMQPSRRSAMLAGAGAVSARLLTSQNGGALTAGQVVERIQKNVGVPWRSETVDTFKAGGAATPVKGIATTMMATLDVLKRASAAGRNFVITHEPTFYNHEDKTADLTGNPVYQYKADFIEKNGMAVWRFHDHWHSHHPDGIATGMAEELAWTQNADPRNPRQFTFPGITLGELARQMQSKLKIRTMRVVGDPALRVRTVAANWGYTSQQGGIQALSRPEVDVLVGGEAREWEVVEFADDAVAAGKQKGLILLGHIVSEQAGMKHCANWLKGFISEVPVEFIPAAEPFWRPKT